MDKDMVELLSKLLTPGGALVAVIFIGIFTALYTAAIEFWFGKKLKSLESEHAIKLAEFQGRVDAKNQVLTEHLQAESNKALKQLEAALNKQAQSELQKSQAALTEEHAKKQSRLDYEYEARKRLYHECEPLVFELLEFSENAGDRIRGLARTARQGDLPGWLSDSGYYMASTMYYLLAPVAVYKLMRRRLTVVDMTLDRNIATHYQLAKRLAWSFVADFAFASGLSSGGELGYDPNNAAWQTLRSTNEAEYWRQGLPYGRLDNAIESLIVRDHGPDCNLRIRSFGGFESELHTAGSEVDQTFAPVRDVFTNFHPATRPVLWRMLIAQAHIYASIVRFHREDNGGRNLAVTPISAEHREPFCWKTAPSDAERQKMDDPFLVAEAYLSKKVPGLWAAGTS